LGYQLRETRCEGAYQQPVAGSHTIRLVAALLGSCAFDVKQGPIEMDLPGRALAIRAQSVIPARYYRMDYQSQPGERHWLWPVDVLRRSNIGCNQLGVSAWVVGSRPEVYVPIALRQGRSAPRATNYTLAFITTYPAEKLTLTMEDDKGTKIGLPQTMRVPRARQAVSFQVERPQTPGIYRLKVSAEWFEPAGASSLLTALLEEIP
jgi:hypothetical protein